jgi:hypothetical protein
MAASFNPWGSIEYACRRRGRLVKTGTETHIRSTPVGHNRAGDHVRVIKRRRRKHEAQLARKAEETAKQAASTAEAKPAAKGTPG